MGNELNDNHGRRNSLRSALSNDPMYRRVKDAMLLILAAIATLQGAGIPITNIFSKDEPMPLRENEARARLWDRVNSSEKSIALLELAIKNINENQSDIKQDVRELLRQVGELRRK